MYTVRQAAQLAQVSPSTLRAWERRYALVQPQRSPAGYRLYDDASLDALRLMAQLVARGTPAHQAAQIVAPQAAAAGEVGSEPTVGHGLPGGARPVAGTSPVLPDPGMDASQVPEPERHEQEESEPGGHGQDGRAREGRGPALPGQELPEAGPASVGQPGLVAAVSGAAVAGVGGSAVGGAVVDGTVRADLVWPVPGTPGVALSGIAAARSRPTARGDLVAAAASFDHRVVESVLEGALSGAGSQEAGSEGTGIERTGIEEALDEWLLPELARLGRSWTAGETLVAQEHLVSAAVMRVLSRHYDALGPQTGPTVLLGLPRGARHEIGLLAFGICARRRGLDTVYLGADIAVDGWVGAVEVRRPRAVVMAAARRSDARSVAGVAQALAGRGVGVWCGGAHAGQAEGVEVLPGSVQQAADELSRLLRGGIVPASQRLHWPLPDATTKPATTASARKATGSGLQHPTAQAPA